MGQQQRSGKDFLLKQVVIATLRVIMELSRDLSNGLILDSSPAIITHGTDSKKSHIFLFFKQKKKEDFAIKNGL